MTSQLTQMYRKLLHSVAWPLAHRAGLLNRPIDVNGNLFIGQGAGGAPVHFHAASAGELEILWPIIIQMMATGYSTTVSVFSSSGERSLKRLYEDWIKLPEGKGTTELRFSPVDGDWEKFLEIKKPKIFITAKYEAWPELWVALKRLNVPLLVVGARARASFRWAKRISGWLGESLPQIVWMGEESDRKSLLELFPKSVFSSTSDPRWDRVKTRLEQPTERATQLSEALKARGEKFGIVGSVWLSDWQLIKPELSQRPGLVVFVPHDVSDRNIQNLNRELEASGFSTWTSNQLGKLQDPNSRGAQTANAWIINEVGVLVELYTGANWIFVGGGFEKGVHSTIEAAFSGAPIACGPKKFDLFSENQQLQEDRQIEKVITHEEFARWLRKTDRMSAEEKERWKNKAYERCGGTLSVFKKAQEIMGEKL